MKTWGDKPQPRNWNESFEPVCEPRSPEPSASEVRPVRQPAETTHPQFIAGSIRKTFRFSDANRAAEDESAGVTGQRLEIQIDASCRMSVLLLSVRCRSSFHGDRPNRPHSNPMMKLTWRLIRRCQRPGSNHTRIRQGFLPKEIGPSLCAVGPGPKPGSI